jgi:hypothetical protein
MSDQAIRLSYEAIQQESRGPGTEEWRRVDSKRMGLADYYASLNGRMRGFSFLPRVAGFGSRAHRGIRAPR